MTRTELEKVIKIVTKIVEVKVQQSVQPLNEEIKRLKRKVVKLQEGGSVITETRTTKRPINTKNSLLDSILNSTTPLIESHDNYIEDGFEDDEYDVDNDEFDFKPKADTRDKVTEVVQVIETTDFAAKLKAMEESANRRHG